MAKQQWLFCKSCYKDRIFELIYKTHGIFGGGHEDWHCTHCGNCDYGPAREH